MRSETPLRWCRRLAVLLIALVIAAGSADAQTRRKSKTPDRQSTRQTTSNRRTTPARTLESVKKDKSTTD
ncbi:MAG: hypothetical protein K2H17_07280, partial [Duncaniella sp.]|uniref:hypothetical protein n=1 Tax=Duncaniella sp. TaxID=2518496 RepID=UPI0023CAB475